MRAIALALLMISAPKAVAAEFDRPFGIERGQRLETLDQPKRRDGNFYDLRSVPKPHPELSRYSVVASKDGGVCSITGYAPAKPASKADRSLTILRAHVSELMGTPQLLPGNRDPSNTGIWLWFPKPHQPGTSSPLRSVALYRYEGTNGAAAMLQVEFSNHTECDLKIPPNSLR